MTIQPPNSPFELQATADELAAAIGRKFQTKGRNFEAVLQKTHARLPRRLAQDLGYLASALQQAQNPKMAVQTDMKRIRRAVRRTDAFLERFDPVKQRERAFYGTTTSIAINILLLIGLFLAVLRWRGLI